MNTKSFFFAGMVVMAVLAGIAYLGFVEKPAENLGAAIPKKFTDLIGTRVASSTTGVGWYGAVGSTTTYPFYLAGASSAVVVFQPTAASTSASTIQISVKGSNDPGCQTATTSTIYNQMTVGDVVWFDAMQYLTGSSVVSSFTNGTSTVIWSNPQLATQRALHFEDLNIECLAVSVSASSTILYGQYLLKE